MIELQAEPGMTLVRLKRGKGNALDIDFLHAMDETLERLESSAATVVLTGEGSVFGAGVDLPTLHRGGPAYIREFLPLLSQVFNRLAMFPKPVVAAVNGHAIAGGAILMLACDQRLLARGGARIGLTEVLVGVRFPAWALEIARFATPSQHFPTLIQTGRTYLPEESLARGLVDELVEPDRLLDRAGEVARELGGILPQTFAATKVAVRRPLIDAVQTALADDDDLIEHWCSEPVQRTIDAFVKKMIGAKGA
jgi:enoyl-CoA hydratase